MTTPGDMNSEEFRLARNARIDASATDVRPKIHEAQGLLGDAYRALCWNYIGGEMTGNRPQARSRLLLARERIDSILDTMHDEIAQEIAADCSRKRHRDGIRGCACCGLDRKYGLTDGLCQICIMRGHERPDTQRDLNPRQKTPSAHTPAGGQQ